MTDRRRSAIRLAVIALLVISAALPVLATEDSTEPGDEVATEGTEEGATEGTEEGATEGTEEGATEGTEESGAETEEPPEPIVTDIDPVVIVTTPVGEAVTADWTYRYLVPTGIALVVIVILVTTARYFTDVVRKRYRIVEE